LLETIEEDIEVWPFKRHRQYWEQGSERRHTKIKKKPQNTTRDGKLNILMTRK